MVRYLNELEHIEQELAEFRNHFEQSLSVLDGLAKVQVQFEDLAQTYQKLKEHLEEVKFTGGEIAQVQETFNQRFAETEKVIESKLGEVKSEVFNLQNELDSAERNLNTEFAQQLGDLKRDVEIRLTSLQKELVSQKEAIWEPLDELETRLRAEIQDFMNRLSETGYNTEHLEKQELLENQLQADKSRLRDVERQIRVMSKWLVGAILVSALALGFAFVKLLS